MFTRLESVDRIILSAGHGGRENERFDPGAVAPRGETENQEVNQIIARLVPKLAANGLVVVVTPDFGLSRTITYINARFDAVTDWAIEVHKDSSGNYTPAMHRRVGVYHHPTSLNSKDIASEMVKVMKTRGASKTSWSRPDTASPHKSLAFVRQPKMLSHIIELGFMQDDLSSSSDEFYADITAEAICHCLGISYNKPFEGQRPAAKARKQKIQAKTK